MPSSETMPSSVTIDRRKSAAPTNSATKRRAGPVVELERRGDLLEPAGVQHPDAIRQRERLLLVVGHEEGRGPGGPEDLADLLAHRCAEIGVEIRERLVEEDRGRAPARARGRARRAAAGRPRARAGNAPSRPTRPTSSRTSRTRSRPRRARARWASPNADVGLDRQVGKQGVVLEDDAHAPRTPAARAQPGPATCCAADLDGARIRRLEARHQPERRRLAAAGGTEERQHLARSPR